METTELDPMELAQQALQLPMILIPPCSAAQTFCQNEEQEKKISDDSHSAFEKVESGPNENSNLQSTETIRSGAEVEQFPQGIMEDIHQSPAKDENGKQGRKDVFPTVQEEQTYTIVADMER